MLGVFRIKRECVGGGKGSFLYLWFILNYWFQIIKCNISSNEIILNIDFIANPNLNSTNPYLYKVTKNHIDSLNLNERYIQENIVEKVQVAKKEPLKSELLQFLDAVANGHAFPVTPWQAVENLRICEKIVGGLSCLAH